MSQVLGIVVMGILGFTVFKVFGKEAVLLALFLLLLYLTAS